jgi:tetratricopeptide (TPR) repeat protein
VKHLSETQLKALARTGLKHPHVQSCPLCRSRLQQLASSAASEYDAVLCRIEQKAGELIPQIQEEVLSTPGLLRELLALPRADRTGLVALEPRFHSYPLALRVLEESAAWIFRDPNRARELARLARSIAVRINPRTCGGSEALTDLIAYAIATEGNALRVRGRLQSALKMFRAARTVQEMGSTDPDLQARIDFLESSLRRDIRQFQSARFFLDRATEGFLHLQEKEQVANTCIARSILVGTDGDYDKASYFLEDALRWSRSPKLILAIRHNFTELLVRSGDPQAAADLFHQTEDLYQQFNDPLRSRRRVWLEALITREIGEDLRRARELLERAVAGFAESGFGMDASLAREDFEILRRREKASGGPTH